MHVYLQNNRTKPEYTVKTGKEPFKKEEKKKEYDKKSGLSFFQFYNTILHLFLLISEKKKSLP